MLLTEDSFVLWLMEKERQEMLKKDSMKNAMIEWLAKACEELSIKLCEYPEFQCPKLKSDWICEAEKAVQNADGE